MEKVNFKAIFDRGICSMVRYYVAYTIEDAREMGNKEAAELTTSGLDTRLVAVYDQADDEYYQEPY